eukprot:136543-Prymnesium_polylepis.1
MSHLGTLARHPFAAARHVQFWLPQPQVTRVGPRCGHRAAREREPAARVAPVRPDENRVGAGVHRQGEGAVELRLARHAPVAADCAGGARATRRGMLPTSSFFACSCGSRVESGGDCSHGAHTTPTTCRDRAVECSTTERMHRPRVPRRPTRAHASTR